MKAYLEERRNRLYGGMEQEGAALLMFEDAEGCRDPSVRWLTGQPGDALLFLSADKRSLLVPWDANMASFYAEADAVIPYTEFDRHPLKALQGAASFLKIPPGSRIEIPPTTSYTSFLKFVEEVTQFDILCRNDGLHKTAEELRMVKDAEEIKIYRKAAKITNTIIDLLEEQVRAGKLKTEIDVALFIEAEARRRGCEGTGFETLAAGPGRSFGIHAFPSFTNAEFASQGLSILDFGLKYGGYTTDVTMTFARGPLTKAQEKMLTLVEKAARLAFSLVAEGVGAREIAAEVESFFGKSKKTMPHSLGHGIGLQIHEAPFLRSRTDETAYLTAGMIFTIEPGLYDPVQGGCRLENDVLLTPEGPEAITTSHIVRL
jgi:Xaa-Pro dipeptidase